MNEISKTRLRELHRMQRASFRLRDEFLSHDTGEPRIFDEARAGGLEATFSTVVEVDATFRKLARLRSERARRLAIWALCVVIRANISSFDEVKSVAHPLLGLRLEHPKAMEPSTDALEKKHRRLYLALWKRFPTPEARMMVLLRLIQVEVTWFGHMW